MTLINQTDSLSVSNDALVELYKTMLDHQISNHTITVSILLAITLILLGVQFLFNMHTAKKLIEEGISSRMETEMKTIELTISKLVDEKIKKIDVEITSLQGESSRLMALAAETKNLHNWAVFYWAEFLACYVILDVPLKIRIGVDALHRNVTNELKPFSKEHLDHIKAVIDKIPDHFFREKENLLRISKTFKTKD